MTKTEPGGPQRPEVGDLSYEQAKDELTAIVAALESGSASLEESMRLWERGEQLAAHCTRWLDQAQRTVDGVTPSNGPLADSSDDAVDDDGEDGQVR